MGMIFWVYLVPYKKCTRRIYFILLTDGPNDTQQCNIANTKKYNKKNLVSRMKY